MTCHSFLHVEESGDYTMHSIVSGLRLWSERRIKTAGLFVNTTVGIFCFLVFRSGNYTVAAVILAGEKILKI